MIAPGGAGFGGGGEDNAIDAEGAAAASPPATATKPATTAPTMRMTTPLAIMNPLLFRSALMRFGSRSTVLPPATASDLPSIPSNALTPEVS